MEQAVRPTERITAHLDDMGLAAMLCDTSGRILEINAPAVELFPDEAVPGALMADLAAKPDDVASIQGAWDGRRDNPSGWDMECQLRGRLGADLDIQMVVIPVFTESGQAWLVTVHNLTEAIIHARELEIYASELSQLYQNNRSQLVRLQEAEKSREQFYSILHHELKTPLTSLKAALEMLSSPEMGLAQNPLITRLVNNMDRSTDRLERLISDLLDVATARSGGLSLFHSPVDMVSVIDQVVDEMTPAARDKGVEVLGRWKKKQGLVVSGDEIRLQQIVANLLNNAIKAAPDDGSVRIEAVRKTPYVQVSVANPGVHLDPAVKDRLFEPFQKSAYGSYKPGSGLGLSVVDSLVRAHDGNVGVEDTGRQVKFTFNIPLWRKGASRQ